MKKLLILSLIVVVSVFFFTACEKDSDQTGFQLVLKVIDADSWSPDNPFANDAENATVTILDSNNPDRNIPLYEGVTDANGKVVFTNIQAGNYFVYIEKGEQCNILEKEMVDGREIGYLIEGIFMTEEEVVTNLSLPGTKPGDPKIVDVNEDGILDENDKSVGNEISVTKDSRFMFYISER